MNILLGICGLLTLVASGSARAHGGIEGVDDFYAGLLHPVQVPAHLLVLLAAGLLTSQYRREDGQRLLAGLIIGLPLGLLYSRVSVPAESLMAIGTLAIALLISLIVVIGYRPILKVLILIGLVTGIWIGADSGHGGTGDASLFTTAMLGTWIGAMAVVCAVAELLIDFRQDWQQLGVRVLGAWISAACILTLVLQVHTDLLTVPPA